MSREFDRREQDSREQQHARLPLSSSQNGNPLGLSIDLDFSKTSSNHVTQSRNFASTPSSATNRFPDRSIPSTRASTVGTPNPDRNLSLPSPIPYSRSEVPNHICASSSPSPPISASTPTPSPAFLSSVKTSSTPATSSKSNQPSASNHCSRSRSHSAASLSSQHVPSATWFTQSSPLPTTAAPTRRQSSQSRFTSISSTLSFSSAHPSESSIRNAVYFDSQAVIDSLLAATATSPPNGFNHRSSLEGPNGKQNSAWEHDYFRRLNLICAKCGMVLRGSFIMACSASLISLQSALMLI